MKFLIFLLLFSPLQKSYAEDGNCVVLMYHHFSEKTPKSTSISPKLFERQLQYLKKNHFNVVPILDIVKRKKLPNKCVALTTDDAYISVYNNAYPLLKKYNMPMAVFIATKAINKKFKAMMSWKQIKEINGKIVQFYNHTVSHAHLIDLSIDEVKNEILLAQNELQTKLGVTAKIFAYPYGEYNEDIYKLVKKLGFVAFGQHSGAMNYNSDFARLPRFPITSNYAKMKSFKTKVNTKAFNIKEKSPISLVVKDLIPNLTLSFREKINENKQQQFVCFGIKDRIKTTWLNNKTVIIKDYVEFKNRRSRYNCTMPSDKKNRYYWVSQQWVNKNIPE